EGANWENTDKRWKHMELGAEMLEEELEAHVKSLEIKPERLRKLSLIVRTHDLPYIRVGSQADTQLPTVTVEELFSLAEVHTYGGDNPVGYRLIDPETRAMRGADRTFVPSALSWYKDMVSHFSDVGYLAKAKGLGFELSPEQFLRSRMAFFWDNAEAVPTRWDLDTFNLDTSRAAYNEGGRCEAPYTSTDAAIISNMMGRRAAELDAVNAATTPDQFAQVFERAFVSEMKYVIERAT
ncbi:MAG: hypothetical protein QF535_16580, partial [Anaerolineales bacterium]|nr:hypothetical protein [Anaerolineales bacterium]